MAPARRFGRGARWSRGAVLAVTVALMGVTAGCGSSGEHGTPTLSWYSYQEPSGAYDAAAKRCSEASNGRYRIVLKALPNNADEQREQLVRRLAARDSDIDLMSMDVIWTAEFAEAKWIQPWTGPALRGAVHHQHRAAVVSQEPQPRASKDLAGGVAESR